LLVIVITTLISCKKEDIHHDHHERGIVIKGKISEGKTDGNSSLSDARKIMVLNKNRMNLYNINDNSFSFSAEWGTGIALIFLDEENNYIGNLSSAGLNLLPLGNLSNGENTVIDLSTLRLEGTTVIPSHDPFGNEIIITEAEVNNLKSVGEYYESIAKNIDANNDGIPDILSDSHLMAYSTYGFINCGRPGINNIPPQINNPDEIFLNYWLHVDGGRNLSYSSISLSGPADSPHNDIVIHSAQNDSYNGGFNATFARNSSDIPDGFPFGTIQLPFSKGTYTLNLNGNDYTIDYANMDAFNNLVIIVPTVNINNQNQVTSVSLDYRFIGGNYLSNPGNIVSNVWCEIQYDGGQVEIYHGNIPGGPDSRLNIKTGFNAIVPEYSAIVPSEISMVSISYDDLLGNSYIILWLNQ
jgi:hypothetical protein